MSDPTAAEPSVAERSGVEPSHTGPHLSVAMIVRDEAALIDAAIASVRALADEIIVVDTGSTDDTAARAAAAGATVVSYLWQDDFAAARNVSLDHCHGDWILILDADERLSEESHDALRQLIAAPPLTPTAYLVRLRNWTDAARQEGFEHTMARLFSRSPEIRFTGRLHEHLVHTTTGKDGIQWQRAPGITIDHLGYSKPLVEQRDKYARNLTLLAQCMTDEPDQPVHHHYAGMVHRAAGRLEPALDAFAEAVRLAAPLSPPPNFLPATHTLQLACLVALGQHEEGIVLAARYRTVCAGEPDFWFNVGLARQGTDDHGLAIAAFQRCLDLDGQPAYMAELGVCGWKSWLAIAESETALGHAAASREAAWAAVRGHGRLPMEHGYLWATAVLTDDAARMAEARALWDAIPVPAYADLVAGCVIDTLSANVAEALAREWGGRFLEALPDGHRLAMILRLAKLEAAGTGQVAFLASHVQEPGVGPYLGQLLLEADDWLAFEELCSHLLALSLEPAYAHAGIGNVRLRNGDPTGAEAAFLQAVAHGATDANLWNNLGVITMNRRNVEEAEGHFLHAVSLDAGHFSANLNLVRTAWWFKEPQTARAWLAKAVTALHGLLQEAFSGPTANALTDFQALHTYFQKWDMSRHRKPDMAIPPGADDLLADLYQAGQAIALKVAQSRPPADAQGASGAGADGASGA